MVYLGDLGEEENVLGSRHCRSRAFLREKNTFKSLLAFLCTFVALTSSAHSADAAPATSPYDVLGIDKTASERDVKRAYRAKSLEFHPDKNNSPDATEKFREVAEAYAILGDEEKRKQYDRFGKTAEGGPGFSRGGGGGGGGGPQMSPEEAMRMFNSFMESFEDVLTDNEKLDKLVDEYWPFEKGTWTSYFMKGAAKSAIRTLAPSLLEGIKNGNVQVTMNGQTVSKGKSTHRERMQRLHERQREGMRNSRIGGGDL